MTENNNSNHWLAWALPALWHKRRLLLVATAIGLVLSVVAAILIPRQYRSTMAIMPPDSGASGANPFMASGLLSLRSAGPPNGLSNLLNAKSPNAVFLAILQSRTAQTDLVNRFDLRRVYRDRTYEAACKDLAKRTKIEEDKKTGVLTVSVEDRSRVRARALAAAYVDELNKLVVVMDTSSAHRERIFLEERLKTVNQDLQSLEAELSRFSSQNGTLDVEHQSSVVLSATAKLQAELIAAQTELSGLEAIYSPGNARVREASARVETLRKELDSMSGEGTTRSESSSADQPYPSLRQLPLLGVTYADLSRRLTVETSVFEILTKQYEMAKINEAKEIPSVTLLDPPNLPVKPYFPPRLIIVFLGALLTLGGAALYILAPEIWRRADDTKSSKWMIRAIIEGCRKKADDAERAIFQ